MRIALVMALVMALVVALVMVQVRVRGLTLAVIMAAAVNTTSAAAATRATTSDVPRPGRIPPDLALAMTFGSHRLLAFQACSEEDCWHTLFVQELGLSPNRGIQCSAPVPQLNRRADVVVRSARWRPGAWPVLELMLESAHDEFAPYAATLSFDPGCRYTLQPEMPPPLASQASSHPPGDLHLRPASAIL